VVDAFDIDEERQAGSEDLTEEQALALLRRRDIPQITLEALAANRAAMRHRRVVLEVVKHPRAPRHVTLPTLRRLFTFELMQVALTPATPADVKLAAENTLMSRLETVSLGERLTLAKRSSARLAAALLVDNEGQVCAAALDNPHITEDSIVKALMKAEPSNAAPKLPNLVLRHSKWSLRTEIQIALLESGKLRAAQLAEVAHSLTTKVLRAAWDRDRLPAIAKAVLAEELRSRDSLQD
jgi:hypothetical protein